MNDNHDQTADAVRGALDRVAAAFVPSPDLDDIGHRRLQRANRQRNALAGVVIAMLAVGPAIGYGMGRLGDDDHVVAGGDDTASRGMRDGLQSVETTPIPEVHDGIDDGDASGGRGVIDDGVEPSAPLGRTFVRTTTDGISLRVYRGALPPRTSETPWAETPGWCFPSGTVYVGASTELAIGAVYGDTYDELRTGSVAATTSVVGLTEGAPMRVVIVQAPEGTARVDAAFPGGTRDEMAPIDGVAVLAAVAGEQVDTDDPDRTPIELRALADDGTVLASEDIAATTNVDYSSAVGGECNVDGQLPPPGEEQPADVEAARVEVVDVYRRIHDGSASPKDRATLLDDPAGFVEITGEILAEFGEPASGARLGDIDLVFTAPDRAAILYSVVASSGTFSFSGEAVLTDGGWKMTRDAWCREIALAGKQC